jgi:hypothetical protein
MRIVRATALPALVLLLAMAACDGAVGPEGDPAGLAGLALRASISPSGEPTVSGAVRDAFLAADSVDVQLLRSSDEATVLDSTFALDPSGGQAEIPVQISLESPSETFLLTLVLRSGTDPLFRGTAEVVLQVGSTADVEVPLEPVPVELLVAPDSVVFDALGDTVQAGASAVVATGDTVPGVDAFWSSTDPQVLDVLSDGRMISLDDGEAGAAAFFGGATDTVDVRVRQIVASVDVSPDSALFFAQDQTRDFDATVTDANGRAVAGAGVAWSVTDSAVVTIDAQGVVRTESSGQCLVVATSGSVADSALVTVQLIGLRGPADGDRPGP